MAEFFLVCKQPVTTIKSNYYGKLIIPYRSNPDYWMGSWLFWIPCFGIDSHFTGYCCHCNPPSHHQRIIIFYTYLIPQKMEINSKIIDKFCGLLHFLNLSKQEFEMVADEIEDCNLKTALHGLSF